MNPNTITPTSPSLAREIDSRAVTMGDNYGMRPGRVAELIRICNRDLVEICQKSKSYRDSWIKRGGVGAFMMLARKWDRLEEQIKAKNWDVIEATLSDEREEGLLDDIQDLRRYLALVESEILLESIAQKRGPVADGKA